MKPLLPEPIAPRNSGYGNEMLEIAYKHLRIGSKYKIPRDWLKNVDTPYMKTDVRMTCVEKNPRYARFVTECGISVCFTLFNLIELLGIGSSDKANNGKEKE